jgi:hypothetical protein
MLNFWKAAPKIERNRRATSLINSAAPAAPETFLIRAKRNDTVGAERRLRELLAQNRLL